MIALAAFIFTVAGTLATVVWRLRSIQAELKEEFRTDIAAAEKETADRLQAIVSGFRDTFAALREKINLVELNTEREFISKDTFSAVTGEIKDALVRMEGKIDKLRSSSP